MSLTPDGESYWEPAPLTQTPWCDLWAMMWQPTFSPNDHSNISALHAVPESCHPPHRPHSDSVSPLLETAQGFTAAVMKRTWQRDAR